MEKKQKTMLWVLGAIVAVLIIVSMTNTTTTGNALFDFLKKDKVEVQPTFENTYQGILAEKGLSKDFLKGYEVKYNLDGELVYELQNGGQKLIKGEIMKFQINGTIIKMYNLEEEEVTLKCASNGGCGLGATCKVGEPHNLPGGQGGYGTIDCFCTGGDNSAGCSFTKVENKPIEK